MIIKVVAVCTVFEVVVATEWILVELIFFGCAI